MHSETRLKTRNLPIYAFRSATNLWVLLSRFGVESRLRNATASLWVLGILLVEGVVEIVSVVEGGRPLPRHHHQHLKSAMV